jgi:hypothetical protein
MLKADGHTLSGHGGHGSLTHMDEIWWDLEMVARKLDQEKPAA